MGVSYHGKTLAEITRRSYDGGRHHVISRPLSTHTVPATCGQVDCVAWLNGWETQLDLTIPEHQTAADWIRVNRRGQFVEYVNQDGLTCFDFPPGLPCLEAHTHRRHLERPPLFVISSMGHTREHVREVDWGEDFAEHHQKVLKRS